MLLMLKNYVRRYGTTPHTIPSTMEDFTIQCQILVQHIYLWLVLLVMLCVSQAPLDDSKFLFQMKYFFILDRSVSSKLFSQEIQIRIIIVLPMVDTLIWQTWLNKVFTYTHTHTHTGVCCSKRHYDFKTPLYVKTLYCECWNVELQA
jgi:hypothetical protein